MEDRNRAGFLSTRRNWRKALQAYRRDLLILLSDVAFLIVMWGLVTYIWSSPERGTIAFLTVPWWIMLVVAVGFACLWQSFGVSPGMKLLGRRLVERSEPLWRDEKARSVLASLIAFGVSTVARAVARLAVTPLARALGRLAERFPPEEARPDASRGFVALLRRGWRWVGGLPRRRLHRRAKRLSRRMVKFQPVTWSGPRGGGLRLQIAQYLRALGRRLLRSFLVPLTPLLLLPTITTARYQAWHNVASGLQSMSVAESPDPRVPWFRRSWMVGILLFSVALFIASAIYTEVDLRILFTNFSATEQMWARILSPSWGILGVGVQLLIVTLFMAFMATLFAIIVAVPLSFVAARNLTQGVGGRIVYTGVRGILSIIRSIQPFIWAIVFIVWVKPNAAPFAGLMALFVHSVADLTKLYAERLESIDPGPVEAIRATGANRLQVILYGIVPQIINPYLSFTIYRWDINVRMSTIVGMVGGGGIGQRLLQEMKVWNWSNAIVFMLLIMVAVWAMDTFSARIRHRIDEGAKNIPLTSYAAKLKTEIANRGLGVGIWTRL